MSGRHVDAFIGGVISAYSNMKVERRIRAYPPEAAQRA
jgi:hypothetical protein